MTASGSGRGVLAVLALLLFAGTVLLTYQRLEASRAAFHVNNCVLGADNASIGAALDQGRYTGLKWRKHPMAVVLVGAVSEPLARAGLPDRQATSLGLALLVGLGAAAMFLFLGMHVTRPLAALGGTLFFLSLFGPLTLFSVTDSYGVTFAASAVAVLLLGLTARRGTALSAGIRSGLVIAVAGLANPPALSIFPIHAALRARAAGAGRLLVDLAVPALVGSLLAVGVPLFLSGGWGFDYAERYAGLDGFRDAAVLLDYVAGFFLEALVSPLPAVQCRYGAALLAEASPVRLAATALALFVLVAGLGRALAGQATRWLAAAALAGTALLFLFYLWFNPGEVLLYSPQWLFLLVLGATAGLGGAWAALPLLAAAVNLQLNLSPLGDPASFDPARCCPAPPATMLDHEHPRQQASRRCAPADAP